MGKVEMGGRGDAAARQGPPGRPPRPRPDLAGRRRNTICRSPTTALPGTRPTTRATRISGKTSSSAGSRPIPGARCGLSDRSSAAGCSTGIRACGWACSNAALAGCRSGPGAWTSRRSMSAAPRRSSRSPSEYMASGRFFCSIEHHEGEDMFNYVTHFLGDDVLMYASDYPHSECQFPEVGRQHPRLVEPQGGYEEKAALRQRRTGSSEQA